MSDASLMRQIGSVPIAALRAFLLRNKFSSLGKWGQFLERFQIRDNDRKYDVLVPTSVELADFSQRMREAVKDASVALNIVQSDLLYRLYAADFRVFKIRAHPNAEISSIPFDEGLGLLESSKSLIRASAIAALGKSFRRVTHGRAPAIVDNYMDRVKIGQTDVGSYVFTLLLPHDEPILGDYQDLEETDQATKSVTSALHRGIETVAKMNESRRVPSEKLLEDIGLPSSFYKSLYDIVDWSDNVSLEIGEPSSLQSAGAVQSYGFGRSVLPLLEKTNERLDPQTRLKVTTLSGTITRLSEPRIRRMGSIDLRAKIDGRERTVRVPFGENERETIITAFREKSAKALKVRGTLRTLNNGHFSLESPSQFEAVRRGSLL